MSELNSREGPRYYARPMPVASRAALARRGASLVRIFARHLGPAAVRHLGRDGVRAADVAVWAAPLRRAFEEAGGTFVKFGQIVASSPGLFGEELSDEFRSCLDTGPREDFAVIRRRIEDELGQDLFDAFASFVPQPIGSASLAVVYRATLRDGKSVAVKVLRPFIETHVATDLDLMEPLFEILTRHTGAQLAGATLQQLDGLRLQIGEELDLRNEARALAHFAKLTADIGLDLVVVPTPYPDLSSRAVLTMDYLDGVAIDNWTRAQELGVNPAPAIDQLLRGFFTMTLRWRTFHGDLHAGNLLLLADGRVGLLDWGIVGRLDIATHQFFTRMIAAVLGDESAWADVTSYLVDNYGPALRDAMGLNDEQLGLFLRSMIEPMLLQPFGEFSVAQMMTLTQAQVAEANGVSLQSRSVKELWRRLRMQRRIHKMAVDGGGLMTEFDRGNFLLGKQLMYFERYGRLYLSDRAILSDRDFLQQLLRDTSQ